MELLQHGRVLGRMSASSGEPDGHRKPSVKEKKKKKVKWEKSHEISYLGLPGRIDLDTSFDSTAPNNRTPQFPPQLNKALRAQSYREDPMLSFSTSTVNPFHKS